MATEPASKSRKLGGGQRQRVAKILADQKKLDQLEDIPVPVKSLVAKDLVYKWAWGKISPQEVQMTADLACKDITAVGGKEPSDLKALADLGGHGTYKYKMHAELVGHVSKNMAMSPLHHCYIPFEGFEKPVFQSMLMPHILFADLYHKYPKAWKASVLPDPEKITEFWKLQENHPAWKKHPISKRATYSTHCIPALVHGDGTPVLGIGKIWAKQLTIFSWASMLGCGLTKDTLFHVWSIFDKVANGATWDGFFTELAWSFNTLWEGVWPKADAQGNLYPVGSPERLKAGKPLAAGYFCCLWSLIGDLDYMSGILKLPHYSLKSGNCAICKCTGGDEASSWKDCRPTAVWTTLFWKKSEWDKWEQRSPCKLFSKCVGLSILSICYDWMHCKHLGTDQVQFGSILYLLVFCMFPQEPLLNLKAVWAYMQAWYRKNSTRDRYFSFSKITMFYNSRKKTAPKLKGKAKQVVSLGGCLLDLWKEKMNSGDEWHKKIKHLLKLNVGLETLLDDSSGDLALGKEDATLFKKFAFGMAQLHRELSEHFQAHQPRLFPDIPKIHHLLHIALECDKLNPSLTWCYKGEDFMGCHRALAQSCSSRLQPPGVCEKMVYKIKLAVHLQLSDKS